MNKKQTGLIFGAFIALMHAIWAILAAIIPNALQNFLNWVSKIHFIKPVWTITAFSFWNAITLIILTFICGYISGWIFAWVWNMIKKTK